MNLISCAVRTEIIYLSRGNGLVKEVQVKEEKYFCPLVLATIGSVTVPSMPPAEVNLSVGLGM